MANVDIKIDDEYIKTIGEQLEKKCEDLQKGIDSYISILEGIINDSIMEGDTSDALSEFLSYAKALSGIIEPVGKETKGLCINYIQEIDIADSELY